MKNKFVSWRRVSTFKHDKNVVGMKQEDVNKLNNKYIVLAMEMDAPYFTFAYVKDIGVNLKWCDRKDAHQSDDRAWLERAAYLIREFVKDTKHVRVTPRFCKVLENGEIDRNFTFELI